MLPVNMEVETYSLSEYDRFGYEKFSTAFEPQKNDDAYANHIFNE
jgi:hypothetical protein